MRAGRLFAGLVAIAAAAALVAQTGRARDLIGASKRLRVVETVSSRMEALGQAPAQIVAGNFRLLREAQRLDPSRVEPLIGIAGQHMLTHQYDLAVEVYRQALAFEPRAEIYYDLSRAYLGAGEPQKSREAFAKAVALNPDLAGKMPRDAMPTKPQDRPARPGS